jgi:phospholipase D1/2
LRAAKRGVRVYGIVYDNVGLISTMDSEHTVTALRGLNSQLPEPRIFVMRHPAHQIQDISITYWSHHDKAIVIDGSIVFWGGLDSCFGRWDYNVHPLADVHPRITKELWIGQDYNNARIRDFSDVEDWTQNMVSREEYVKAR